jgi:phytol kinase
MPSEVMATLVLALISLLILLLGEGIHRALPHQPEIARKSVHFLSGLTALSFPYWIQSHWLVLLLASSFLAIVAVAKRKGMLKSIHGIGRKSYGALYFPLAVYGIFLLGHTRPVLYFIAILVMTVSDTLAALLGERYGSIRYAVEGTVKSLEGSVVFLFVTFLCVHLSLLLLTPIDKRSSIVIALVMALLVTGFEAISVSGFDNIFVPFGTYFILVKMTPQRPEVTVEDLWKLLVLIAVTTPLAWKSRLFQASGLVGMVLLNYASWILCDFYWFLPLLLAQILLYLLTLYFVGKVAEEVTGYQIMVLLYSALIPIGLIFLSNTMDNRHLLYLPYLTAVAGQVAIIFYFFVTIMKEGPAGPGARLKSNPLLAMAVCGTAATLLIGVPPLFLYGGFEPAASLAIVEIGVLTALSVFHVLLARYRLRERRALRQKIRLLCVALGTAAALLVEAGAGGAR